MTDLVSPSAVRDDPHNPRETDPVRLELTRLSLAKFGFMLPLYATRDGMLLSGHQRKLAAKELGWMLPVRFRERTERDASGLNLTFNRATNDFSLTDIDHAALPAEELSERLFALPDTAERYPCLKTRPFVVMDLLRKNADRFERYAANAARQLASYGIDMPPVVTMDGRVVNGIGRVQEASAKRQNMMECVVLDQSIDAELAAYVLNRLSMDFRFSAGFKDRLRSNSHRRARQRRKSLGSGYVFALNVKRCKDFSLGSYKEQVRALYGDSILDFGSGHGDEARKLRKIGLSVTTFEPYKSMGPKPSVAAGRRSAASFLKAVKEGRQFSSIMISSVLNSVPFPADREHIVTICAALFGPGTTLFVAARSLKDPNWRECSVGIGLGTHAQKSARFALNEEAGTAVSELNDAPKIQKFFQPSEFERLFNARFNKVEIGEHINNVTAICSDPRPLDPAALRSALEFEFNLPYPEGRMNMVPRAVSAFETRLGVKL